MSCYAGLRVLSFTTLFPNPAAPVHGLFVKNRLERMARACRLTVVAPVNLGRDPRALWRVPLKEELPNLTVYHPGYALMPGVLKHLDGRFLFAQVSRRLRRLLSPADYDVLDVHYAYPDGLAGELLARRAGKPFALSVRGSDLQLLARFPRRRRLIVEVLTRAAAVIAVSRPLADAALALGADPRTLHVIPNGVDTARFFPQNREGARRRLGCLPEARLILAVGRLVPVKGLDLLVWAVATLRDRLREPLRCYIVGTGPLRRALERLIEALRLEDQIVFTGGVPQSELAFWYNAADLLCVTSHSEGCPNVVLESLACGTPVVSTDVGGVGDLLHEGRNGLLVRTRSEVEAAASMQRALRTEWDRVAICRSPAVQDWSQGAERQVELLHRIASRA
jgi:glycosyltransferase involved in cell wall biosynthesis